MSLQQLELRPWNWVIAVVSLEPLTFPVAPAFIDPVKYLTQTTYCFVIEESLCKSLL